MTATISRTELESLITEGDRAVANRLEQPGYTNVRRYREGIQDWVEAGNATESTAA